MKVHLFSSIGQRSCRVLSEALSVVTKTALKTMVFVTRHPLSSFAIVLPFAIGTSLAKEISGMSCSFILPEEFGRSACHWFMQNVGKNRQGQISDFLNQKIYFAFSHGCDFLTLKMPPYCDIVADLTSAFFSSNHSYSQISFTVIPRGE